MHRAARDRRVTRFTQQADATKPPIKASPTRRHRPIAIVYLRWSVHTNGNSKFVLCQKTSRFMRYERSIGGDAKCNLLTVIACNSTCIFNRTANQWKVREGLASKKFTSINECVC